MAWVAIYETQYFDDDGAPLAGGKLYAFAAGTSTPATIYSTAALTGAYAVPLPLDASGRAAGQMYMAAGSYDYEMKDANSVSVWTASAVPTIETVTS